MYEIAWIGNIILFLAFFTNFIKNSNFKFLSINFINAVIQFYVLIIITLGPTFGKYKLLWLDLHIQNDKFMLLILATFLNLIFIFRQKSFGIFGKNFLVAAACLSILLNLISFAAFVVPVALGAYSDEYNDNIRNK